MLSFIYHLMTLYDLAYMPHLHRSFDSLCLLIFRVNLYHYPWWGLDVSRAVLAPG